MSDDDRAESTVGEQQSVGVAVSSDGTHHVLTGDAGDIYVAPDLTEYRSAVCGGQFTGPFLGSAGMRFSDAMRRDEMCDTCLDWLKRNDVTVPGFMKDGEVVARV